VDLQAQLEFEAAFCVCAAVPKFFPQFFQAYGKRVWDELKGPAIMVFPTIRSFNHGAYMQSDDEMEARLRATLVKLNHAAPLAILALQRARYRIETPWYAKLWHRITGQYPELR
jgi:hypothetical protein